MSEASAPCTNVSAVAYTGLSPSLLFRWVKIYAPSGADEVRPAEPTFLPVALSSVGMEPPAADRRSSRGRKSSPEPARAGAARLKIELANGRRERLAGVDAAMLKQIIDVLES